MKKLLLLFTLIILFISCTEDNTLNTDTTTTNKSIDTIINEMVTIGTMFQISKYEVMVHEYLYLLNSLADSLKLENELITFNNKIILNLDSSNITYSSDSATIFQCKTGFLNYPIAGITMYGANLYCEKNNFKLPTESEWELAAKGGDSTAIFPSGSSIDKHSANYEYTSAISVGSLNENGFALHDMAGNVWEFCSDTTISMADTLIAIRGGSYADFATNMKCTSRKNININRTSKLFGFRVVKRN